MVVVAVLAIPAGTGVLCLLVPQRRAMDLITVAASLAIFGLALDLAVSVVNSGPISSLNHFFYVDALSSVMLLIIAVVALTTSLFSAGYMSRQPNAAVLGRHRIDGYYVLFHAFLLAMLLVPVVNNLGILWMAIEATTLASALLVALYGTREALEAAWKYVLIGSVGIALALFATVLVYYAGIHALGQSNADLNWTTLMAVGRKLDPTVMRLVFVFALIGYGTKVGLAPMHTWLPDAHSEAPVPVSALLSGVLLALALYAVLRFYMLASETLGRAYPSDFLMAFGFFSIFVATLFIVRQTDYKRLLAYSSVENMGIITVGFAIGGPLATYGALFQLINHAIVKSLMFFVMGNVLLRFKSKEIVDVRGLLRVSPLTAAALLVGGLALVGSPPFAPFISEMTILLGAFRVQQPAVALGLIVLLSVTFVALLRYVNEMTFGRPTGAVQTGPTSAWIAGAFVASAVPIVVFGVFVPDGVIRLLHDAAGVLATLEARP